MAHELKNIEEWTQFVKEKLDASQFVSLATQGVEGPWVCPVYFAFDAQFNLYFISQPATSLHMQHIAESPAVACAVYDSHQKTDSKVAGVQIKGKAHFVDADEVQHAFDTYFAATPARTPSGAAHRPEAYAEESSIWRLVKIVPEEIWVFSEEDFEGSRVRMPHEVLDAARANTK